MGPQWASKSFDLVLSFEKGEKGELSLRTGHTTALHLENAAAAYETGAYSGLRSNKRTEAHPRSNNQFSDSYELYEESERKVKSSTGHRPFASGSGAAHKPDLNWQADSLLPGVTRRRSRDSSHGHDFDGRKERTNPCKGCDNGRRQKRRMRRVPGEILMRPQASAQVFQIEIANTTVEYGSTDVSISCVVTNGSTLGYIDTTKAPDLSTITVPSSTNPGCELSRGSTLLIILTILGCTVMRRF
uniref:Uncharacterized protein n=1 Tax=Magallana gigas TaxID=29159 RepID=A0A8W8M376_MAGGI